MAKVGRGIVALIPIIVWGVVEVVKLIADLVKTPDPPTETKGHGNE